MEHSPVQVNHLADGAASSQQLVVSLQEARVAARLEVMVAAGEAVAVMEAPIRESG